MLDDISFKKITINDFDHVHLTRLNNKFEPVLNLCKLFISQSSVELSVDKIDTFSFIFDMNALFEKFIGEFIKREFSDIYDTITLQGPRRWFVKNKVVDNEGMGVAFQMRPDIVFEKKGPPAEKLIIDTNYKLLQRQDKKEGLASLIFIRCTRMQRDICAQTSSCFIRNSRGPQRALISKLIGVRLFT